jgi:hypothetical protein
MRSGRWWILLLLMVTSAAFARGGGKNVYLEQARVLYEGLEYERALQRLGQAALWRGNSHQDQVDIELYSGLCEYNLGHKEQADDRFQMALRLDREAHLPRGISPRISRAFARVKAQLPTTVEPQSPDAPTQTTETAQVTPSLTPKEVPSVVEPAATVATELRQESPSHAPSIVLGAAAVAAVGLGAYFGLQAKNNENAASSLNTPWAQAQADLSSAKGQATGANVAFAVAGSAAVTAIILLATGH